jgi:hypothetical protein
MKDLIRRILREETSDRFGSMIKKLLDKRIHAAYQDQICDIQVEKFSYEWGDTYYVNVVFDIGSGIDQVNHESILSEIYDLMDRYFAVSVNVGLEFTRGCKEGINEQSEDKLVPLIRRLLRKRIIETYSDEVCDIKVNVFNTRSVDYKRYWIDLIFDGNNLSSIYSIKNIMDETSNLVKGYFNIQPFMNSQIVDGCEEEQLKGEQNEGEITERCWKGYTQKGMKTMFGKRYPNCVKKKK